MFLPPCPVPSLHISAHTLPSPCILSHLSVSVPPPWPRPCTLSWSLPRCFFPSLCPCSISVSVPMLCPHALSHLCPVVPMPCLAPSPLLSPSGHSRMSPETRPCHCTPLHPSPPQHARGHHVWAGTWWVGSWQPVLPVLPVPPSPLPTVRRTLKSGLSDELVQALGLGQAPGMEV